MPLSPPAPRQQVHRRAVECHGYRREDGLWDIEGRLLDSKATTYSNADGRRVAAGEPVHDMWLRLTVDDDMIVQEVEASTDKGPYRVCPAINDRYRHLVGLRIGPGWSSRVNAVVGGTNGCTHLGALLQVIAATAFQTIFPVLWREKPEAGGAQALMLDSCHAFAQDGEVVRRFWPQLLPAARGEAGGAAGGGG